MGPLPILSSADVSAKPAEYPAAEANIHVNIYHQCDGLILLIWGRGTGMGLGLPLNDILLGYAGNIGEALKGLLIVLLR